MTTQTFESLAISSVLPVFDYAHGISLQSGQNKHKATQSDTRCNLLALHLS